MQVFNLSAKLIDKNTDNPRAQFVIMSYQANAGACGNFVEEWRCECIAGAWRFSRALEELHLLGQYTGGLTEVDESFHEARNEWEELMGF